MLKEIKAAEDTSLAFRHACGSGICGSCTVRVDGRPVIACTYKPNAEAITVEPLEGVGVLRDLIIDETVFEQKQRLAKTYLTPKEGTPPPTQNNREQFSLQAGCIECGSCYSACPVIKVTPEFIGPFILTKSWRYVADSREGDETGKIDAVQPHGVWDCILCGDCVPVCPQGISPKMDITFLQMRSTAHGHMNPNFGSFGGFGDFTPAFG
jgi:fumarate reductase iron-sulfur subunit